jgi:Arc/MetJ-type ribon-helix-helix transcriptional regulator
MLYKKIKETPILVYIPINHKKLIIWLIEQGEYRTMSEFIRLSIKEKLEQLKREGKVKDIYDLK